MRCELDSGAVRDVRTAQELQTALGEVADGGHLILSGGTDFIQARREGHDALLQYGDGSRLWEAEGSPSWQEAQELIRAFFSGDASWKSRMQWSAAEMGGAGGGPAEGAGEEQDPGAAGGFNLGRFGKRGGGDAGPGGRKERGLAETVADEAVRAVKQKAGRAIRQGIRRFMK
jgi:hypothetical protein